MKATEFIGMHVIDKEANDVGKIAEMAIKLQKCMVNRIFISVGGALSKKYFAIAEGDIAEIGDYVQLNLDKEEINEKSMVDNLENMLSLGSRFKDLVGKVVITQKGMEVGKVSDMIIDPKGCLIHNVVINTGTTFNKKSLIIAEENISAIGDYMILKLTKEEVEDMIVDQIQK